MQTTYRAILEKGDPVAAFPRGGSMRPLIWQGKTSVGIIPLNGEPKINDIVVFSRAGDNQDIMHRLIAIKGDKYITRGDNCLGVEVNTRSQIYGVVTQLTTRGKTIKVTDAGYLRYVKIWNAIWPIRKRIFQLRAMLFKIKQHLIGRKGCVKQD